MNGTSARQQKLLRLGLAAGAASIGAVAVSLLIGGSAASAADDDLIGLDGATTALAPASVGVLDTGGAAAPAAAPVVAAAPPVVQAVVAAPVAAVQPVAEAAAQPPLAAPIPPVPPVLQPLSPATQAVESLVEHVAADVVAPTLSPVIETIDGTVGSLPIVDDALDVLEPVIVEALAPGVPASPTTLASKQAVAGGIATAAEKPRVELYVVDASAVTTSAGAAFAAPARMVAVAPPSPAGLTPLATEPPPLGDRIAPNQKAVVPSGVGGQGAAPGQPAADTHAHSLPALTGGKAGAVDDDRAPASPVEERTARPD